MLKLMECEFSPPDKDNVTHVNTFEPGELVAIDIALVEPKIMPAQMLAPGAMPPPGMMFPSPRAWVQADPDRPRKVLTFKIVPKNGPVPTGMKYIKTLRMPDMTGLSFYFEDQKLIARE